MADLNDVQRIALSLPETTMDDDRIAFSVNNKGKRKGIAWVWMERIHPKKARVPNLSVLAIRVRDLAEQVLALIVANGVDSQPGDRCCLVNKHAFSSLALTLVYAPECTISRQTQSGRNTCYHSKTAWPLRS